jgi:hypothetical protein
MGTDTKNDSQEKSSKFSDLTWTMLFIALGVFLIATIMLLIFIWETPTTLFRPFFQG